MTVSQDWTLNRVARSMMGLCVDASVRLGCDLQVTLLDGVTRLSRPGPWDPARIPVRSHGVLRLLD
jgi:hypothetical protein